MLPGAHAGRVIGLSVHVTHKNQQFEQYMMKAFLVQDRSVRIQKYYSISIANSQTRDPLERLRKAA